jgi:hypothetical protein
MSESNMIQFLRTVAARPDLLGALKTRSKDEVLAVAAAAGLPFTDEEFNTRIWDLEAQLAARRGEAFDNTFPLWQTLWGQHYLEYLVIDLLPSFEETNLA